MVVSDLQVRVRYAETDRMGYVYYGNYSIYFEVGRVETLRKLGFSYKQMEDEGVMLPVLEYAVKYFKPAYYDDLLTVRTSIPEVPTGARITFLYETFNESGELLNKAETTLVFVNKINGKPCAAPDWFIQAMRPFFEIK